MRHLGKTGKVQPRTFSQHGHTHTSVDRQIVLGDSAGEISVMFHPRRGGADIQSDPLSRVTSKAR